MLIIGESYSRRKQFILSCIATGRQLLRTIIDRPIADNRLQREAVEGQKFYIKHYMDELVRLERWRIRKGMDKDEIYSPRIHSTISRTRTDI